MNNEFYNNSMIQGLAPMPIWTTNISGTKVPLAPLALLTDGEQRGLRNDDTLVTLAQLPANMPHVIKLNTRATHVLAFDIEAKCVNENSALTKLLLSIPHGYLEYSVHNGYHMLVNVSDDVIKQFGNLWDAVEINVNHLFEIFPAGKHALSLTGKVTTSDVAVDPTALTTVLGVCQRAATGNNADNVSDGHAYKRGQLQVTDRNFVKSLATNVLQWSHLDFSKADEVSYDNSKFEFRVMSMLAARLQYRLLKLQAHPQYQSAIVGWHYPTANDFVATLATMTTYVLTKRGLARKKWHTKRDGNYYLTFMACQWYGRYGHNAYGKLN